jgi:hypothetical protein
MKLTFRKHEVKSLRQLEVLVTEHADAIEPGCRIVAAGVNLGRSTVDLAGVDSRQTPVLVALGFTADDEMLFSMLEAYAWCLEYPESVRRFAGDDHSGWPPRIVFIAERVAEGFLRKLRLLKFPAVDCFEYRCVDVDNATGFYLDPVDWSRGSSTPGEAAAPGAPSVTPAGDETSVVAVPDWAAVVEGPERREWCEPVADPTAAQHGEVESEESPRWLERLASPIEPTAMRGAPEPELPAAPVEPRRPAPELEAVESSAELESKPRDVLPSIELPPTRELGPTWRKFLEKLTSGFDVLAAPPFQDAPPARAPAAERELVPTPASSPGARHGRNGASAEKHALLDSVRLPPNSELAPQWRRFLDKQSLDEGKIGPVKEYLHHEFPLCTIYDFFEFERSAHVFQLQDNPGKVSQLATVATEFFEARRSAEIRPWLERHKLAQAMRQAGQAGVLVSASGLEIEKR